MIEMELLHNKSVLGVTMHLPKTKIFLLYHTNGIVVSDPFLLESKTFDKINVLYVSTCNSVDEMLNSCVDKFRLVENVNLWVGMKVVDALEILQK